MDLILVTMDLMAEMMDLTLVGFHFMESILMGMRI